MPDELLNGQSAKMPENFKGQKISEYLKESIDRYLMENSDIFGFSFVHDIIISEDLRRAIVFVEFADSQNNDAISEINSRKLQISEMAHKKFSSKYFPKLVFKKYEGENEDI